MTKWKKNRKKKSISGRILRAITFLSLTGIMVAVSGAVLGMFQIQKEIDFKIIQTEAEQKALNKEQIEMAVIKELCTDVEEVYKQYENAFEQYKNAVSILSELTASIYEHPTQYGEGEILNRSQGNMEEENLYYCLSKELSYYDIEQELKRFGAAKDIFASIKNVTKAKAVYFASAKGCMIAMDDNSIKRREQMIDGEHPEYFGDYDPREREWYKSAKEGEYGFFYEDIDGDNVITCSCGVYKEEQLLGVAAIDIPYHELFRLLEVNTEEENIQVLELINAEGENVFEGTEDDLVDIIEIMGVSMILEMELEAQNEKNVVWKRGTGDTDYVSAGKKIAETNLFLMEYEDMEKAMKLYQENMGERLSQFEDLQTKADKIVRDMLFIFLLLFVVIFVFIVIVSRLISLKITRPIQKLTEDVSEISEGNLECKVAIHTGDELEQLGNVFNRMTDSLKEYMENLKCAVTKQERITTELNVASSIQRNLLPDKVFSKETSFDICAFMQPAKEVGGDYYDYFMIDERHLVTIIADVSGKGVPAALFMMRGKTLMRSQTAFFSDPAQIMQKVNRELCENNEEMMFITSFFCILDLLTGELTYVNAGHNPPLIYRKEEKSSQYIKNEAELVLAVMEDMEYQKHRLWMKPGDRLFLYTDGVTEAMNEQGNLYGEHYLLEVINGEECKEVYGRTLLQAVKESIQNFSGKAEQTDDITMASMAFLEYKTIEKEEEHVWSFETAAVMEKLDLVLDFTERMMKHKKAPQQEIARLQFIMDELFSNIAGYAYPEGIGVAIITGDLSQEKCIAVTIEDNGIFYNLLERELPDTELPPEDRKIGGLGVFLVKNMAEHMEYQRVEDRNIVKVTISWG